MEWTNDDLLVIRAPSTVLNPTLDRRPRGSDDAKICDGLSTGTAAVRKNRSFADDLPNGAKTTPCCRSWSVPGRRNALQAAVEL